MDVRCAELIRGTSKPLLVDDKSSTELLLGVVVPMPIWALDSFEYRLSKSKLTASFKKYLID